MILLGVSCGAALLFQISAARALCAWLGNGSLASAAIHGAFLLAWAAGAIVLGRSSDRLLAPGARFAWIVLAASAFVIASPWWLGWMGPWMLPRLGIEYGVGWILGSLPLLAVVPVIPAFLLGGLVPLLVADHRGSGPDGPGWLFGAASAGAAVGVLLGEFVTLPYLGVHTSLVLAGVILFASGLSGRFALSPPPSPARPRSESSLVDAVRFAPFVSALAGFAIVAMLIAATRLCMQYLPGSAWSFGAVMTTSLVGTAGGALLGALSVRRWSAERVLLPVLLPGLAGAIAITGPLLHSHLRGAGGAVMDGAAGQLWMTAALLPAAMISGALFAALASGHRGGEPGAHFARISAASAFGSLTAVALVGPVLLPQAGAIGVWWVAAATPWIAGVARLRSRALPFFALAAGVLFLPALVYLDPRVIPRDPIFTELQAYREGALANVVVMKSPRDPQPAIYVDGAARPGGGSAGRIEARRQALVPLAIRGATRNVLALGMGTGSAVNAMVEAGAGHVTAVESLADLFDVLPLFASTGRSPVDHPRVDGVVADPAAFARQSRERFDLVIGDLYVPWSARSAALYTREHFDAVRTLLNEDGMFVQWVPLHQLRWEHFGLIARTFTRVFPQTQMFLLDGTSRRPVIGLVGSMRPLRIDMDELTSRILAPAQEAMYAEVGVDDAGDLLELYVGDQHTIDAQFGGDRALGDARLLNTLDRPILAYRAAQAAHEGVALGLTNWNNVALYLGGLVTDLLPPPIDDAAREARQDADLKLRRRSSAMSQFLAGRYWRLRSEVEGEDRLALEDREIEKYLQGLVYDPRHELLNRAAVDVCKLRLRDRRHTAAAELAQAIVHKNPANADAVFCLGLAYLFLGESTLAITALQKAVDLSPEDPERLSRLGIARYLNGETEAALEVLLEAQKRSPVRLDDFSFAVAFACNGDREQALLHIARMIDDPLWGTPARQARALFEAIPPNAD